MNKLLLFGIDSGEKRLTHSRIMQELAAQVSKSPNYDKFKKLVSNLQNSFSASLLIFKRIKSILIFFNLSAFIVTHPSYKSKLMTFSYGILEICITK